VVTECFQKISQILLLVFQANHGAAVDALYIRGLGECQHVLKYWGALGQKPPVDAESRRAREEDQSTVDEPQVVDLAAFIHGYRRLVSLGGGGLGEGLRSGHGCAVGGQIVGATRQ
jgi:hypothetical protein